MVALSAPYQMLSECLDMLVDAGGLAVERRPFAELKLWATVHGLSVLMLDGPLRFLPEDARAEIVDSMLSFCLGGLRIDA